MQVFSETADSSQTKLIGEDLLIGENGIGYLNLAFEAKKGRYWLKALETSRRTRNSELEHKYKRVYNKESFKNR